MHLPYVLMAMGFGAVWLLANPQLWRRSDRDAAVYLVYMAASLAVALLLRGRIQRASGWSLWGLAVVVPLIGHVLVTWGLGTALSVRDGMLGMPGDSWLDGVLKVYVILPAVSFPFTLFLMPVYVPLGALYVWVLRGIDRGGGLRPAIMGGAIVAAVAVLLWILATGASASRERRPADPPENVSGGMPPEWTERTIPALVRRARAVVVARAATPFVVTERREIAKGPPYAWSVLRFRIVEVLKQDEGLPPAREEIAVSLYDAEHFARHSAYYELGVSASPARDPAKRPYPTSVGDLEREAGRAGVILFLGFGSETAPGRHDGYHLLCEQSYESLGKLDEVRRELREAR